MTLEHVYKYLYFFQNWIKYKEISWTLNLEVLCGVSGVWEFNLSPHAFSLLPWNWLSCHSKVWGTEVPQKDYLVILLFKKHWYHVIFYTDHSEISLIVPMSFIAFSFLNSESSQELHVEVKILNVSLVLLNLEPFLWLFVFNVVGSFEEAKPVVLQNALQFEIFWVLLHN